MDACVYVGKYTYTCVHKYIHTRTHTPTYILQARIQDSEGGIVHSEGGGGVVQEFQERIQIVAGPWANQQAKKKLQTAVGGGGPITPQKNCIRACIHTYTYVYIHTNIHTYILHTYKHTYIHTYYIHTYIHTLHTHTCAVLVFRHKDDRQKLRLDDVPPTVTIIYYIS